MPTTRKPEVIVREIEQTRAELAETIDAITGRINPRRAASRGARAVREQVSSARDRVGDAASGAAEGERQHLAPVALVEHHPRPAVIVAAGAVALLGLVLLRRRR